MPWVRCPIIGSGDPANGDPQAKNIVLRLDSFRPALHGVVSYSTDIPLHPVLGIPMHANVVCWVPSSEVLPDPLPAGWDILPEAAATGLIIARNARADVGAIKWRL